jgi:hypothetical protein
MTHPAPASTALITEEACDTLVWFASASSNSLYANPTRSSQLSYDLRQIDRRPDSRCRTANSLYCIDSAVGGEPRSERGIIFRRNGESDANIKRRISLNADPPA